MSLVEALCTYVNSAQSTTWWHLQTISTHSVDEGGLGLFQEGSREFRAVFSQMPGTIIEDRPESTMNFPWFLRGREKRPSRCVPRKTCRRATSDKARAGLPQR